MTTAPALELPTSTPFSAPRDMATCGELRALCLNLEALIVSLRERCPAELPDSEPPHDFEAPQD